MSLENNPRYLEMMDSELGSDTALVPRPTWGHNPRSLEAIGLSMVEVKSISKGCILPG